MDLLFDKQADPATRRECRGAGARLQSPRLDPAAIVIRRLRQSDADSVRAGFDRLSPQARLDRWGHAVVRPARELAWLSELAGSEHLAVGACDGARGAPVGLARYVRSGVDVAEIAVTVLDEWQRRGLGRRLLEELCDEARAHGVRALTAAIGAENLRAIRLFASLGARRTDPTDHGLLGYALALSRAPDGAAS
jgi:GNAT superfamily N-acetyltransferase